MLDNIALLDNKIILWREVIETDGIKTYHRGSVCPGDDLTHAPDEVKALAEKEWTPEIIEAYRKTITPSLTDEQLEAQAEATRQALFAEYDHMVEVLTNQHRRKDITDAEYEQKLAVLDAYAEALRAANDIEGWYKNPQWQPPKPEV